MRNWFENAAAILTVSVFASLAIAQQHRSAPKVPIDLPANSKFSIQIDLGAIKQTNLGQMLFDLAKQKAIEEIGKEGGKEQGLEKLTEMLGIDPFEEIQSITLSSAEFENPENSLLAVVRLRKNPGNLEGLALGLPEYEASKYKNHDIHSTAPDKRTRVFGAIHANKNEDRTIVLSRNKSIIETVLDGLDNGSNSDPVSGELPLVRMHLFEIPMEKLGQGPQANVAKIVKTFMLDVLQGDEEIALTAKITTETDKQAEQVRQMAQGLIAMVEFAQAVDSDDADLKKIRDVLIGVNATRDGTDVQIGFKLNSEKIASAIAEELHLDLAVNRAKLEQVERARQEKEINKLEEVQRALEKAQQELERLKKEVEAQTKETKRVLPKAE